MSERYDQFKWIGQIDEEAKLIRNFVVNHSTAFTIYNKYSKLKLLGVTETRFASTLILVKSALQRMVIDESWRFYREEDSQKVQKIKEILVSDLWWDNVEYLLDFSEPIVSMLRVADTDTPMLHLVYEKWDSMIEEIRKRVFRHEKKNTLTDESKFYDEMHEVLVRRWNKSSTPLHCLAHSLNPKYYSNEWLSEGIGRIPPNLDEEISEGRNACFERLFSSVTMLRKVREEYGKFSAAIGNFGRWEALSERYTINPLAWWGNHGSNAPTLASLAFRVLGQPCSSSCCERNWSTFGMISSIKRNRLTSQRAEDLVYVHSNLRLLSRVDEHYVEGPSKYWDAVGDEFNLEGPSDLQFANLSLDDPVLESMNFEDDEMPNTTVDLDSIPEENIENQIDGSN
ncbi:hypothetical protein HHK36_000725 [Tetracentron sinense]|uniref:HAT C-terminal dimerisation domain-containing protein n=1 Tax=Tetracentron sinense TaxID=13715 RepID=A0A834ZW10_TETSI|nr:hypothetical protein HHK36_000725 [Tetracentron sinense]